MPEPFDPSRPRRMSSLDPSRRRTPKRPAFDHGYQRRAEPNSSAAATAAQIQASETTAHGLPVLISVICVALTCAGIARVRASTDVLAVAHELTVLSEQHAELLDRKRRLEAERAYLRHPERVRRTAVDELGMTPISPDMIQQIEVIGPMTSTTPEVTR